MRSLPLAALPLLAACAATPAKAPPPSGQTYPQALTMICDVDRLAGVSGEGDPIGAGVKRSAWLADHVENPDAIELKTLMSVKGPSDQAKMLREELKDCGVTACALADALEKDKTGEGGIAP